jgi:hypothetical protein
MTDGEVVEVAGGGRYRVEPDGWHPLDHDTATSECDAIPVGMGEVPLAADVTEAEVSEPRPRGLRLIRASDVEAEPVEWVEEGTIPAGNVTALVGPPGLAKTTILCEKGARLSRGQLHGAFYGKPMNVVLMSGEDSIANTLRPRCEAAGGDLDRIYFVEFGDEGFSLPDDLTGLETLLDRIDPVAMVGIDPLMAFVSDRINSHRDHHVRRVFRALWGLADRRGLAVVVVLHLNKGDARDLLARINGSVGIGAAVRAALAVVGHPEDPEGPDRVVVHIKHNLGPRQPTQRFHVEGRTVTAGDGREISTSGIVWLGVDLSVTAENVLADPKERTRMEEAMDFLRGAGILAAARLARDLEKEAASLGIHPKVLQRARRSLGVDVWKDGFQGPTYWGPRPTPNPEIQSGHPYHVQIVQIDPDLQEQSAADTNLDAEQGVQDAPEPTTPLEDIINEGVDAGDDPDDLAALIQELGYRPPPPHASWTPEAFRAMVRIIVTARVQRAFPDTTVKPQGVA